VSESKWTHFHDMHSGGGAKVVLMPDGTFKDGESRYKETGQPKGHIFIEAPEDVARVVFYNRFGHSPDRVTCTCCGDDYSVSESDSLAQATGYNRRCRYDEKTKRYIEEWDDSVLKYCQSEKDRQHYREQRGLVALDDYLSDPEVLVIYAKDIAAAERAGDVPTQGYVWR
jgi:hypothetical protein